MPLAERARTKLGNIQILIYIVKDIRRRHSLKTFVEDISSHYVVGIKSSIFQLRSSNYAVGIKPKVFLVMLKNPNKNKPFRRFDA